MRHFPSFAEARFRSAAGADPPMNKASQRRQIRRWDIRVVHQLEQLWLDKEEIRDFLLFDL
jgi:hypothetical protein